MHRALRHRADVVLVDPETPVLDGLGVLDELRRHRPGVPVVVTPALAGTRRQAGERLATLSPRESDVVHLVAEGLSNAEIGRRLQSEATIETYVSRVLAKLDSSNRVQAGLLVRDTGNVSSTDGPSGDCTGGR